MALVSAQRVQSLYKLRLDNMKPSTVKITFRILELVKQSRPGTSGLSLEFRAYPPDPRLCVMTHLLLYLRTTKALRGSKMALWVSFKQPHGRVSVPTISRWLRQVLGAAGVDTDILKSHSTRAAATLAAINMEVPMGHILATAGWSTEKMFQIFYNKPIAKPAVFAERI